MDELNVHLPKEVLELLETGETAETDAECMECWGMAVVTRGRCVTCAACENVGAAPVRLSAEERRRIGARKSGRMRKGQGCFGRANNNKVFPKTGTDG